MDITFPAFMKELPDEDPETEDNDGQTTYKDTLYALAQLSIQRSVFEVLLTRLLNKLTVVLRSGCGPSYPHAILSTILFVLQKKLEKGETDIPSYYKRIVLNVMTQTILSQTDDSEGNALSHYAVLEITGSLINLIVRCMNVEEQVDVMQQFFNLFVLARPSSLITSDNEKVAQGFSPLTMSSPPSQAATLTIFAHVLAGSTRKVR